MADYSALLDKLRLRASGWGTVLRDFISQVGTDLAGKAPADHVHEGAGGDPLLSRDGVLPTGLTLNLDSISGQVEVARDGTVQRSLAGHDLHSLLFVEMFG